MNNMIGVVLAAGEGVRMNSKIPKVLHEVCGKPMINLVVETIKNLGCEDVFVVVSPKSDDIKKCLKKERVKFCVQEKKLGTGDALLQTMSSLDGYDGNLVVVCGDTPLLRTETLKELADIHDEGKNACTVLTTILKDPTGYGRVVRNSRNRVIKIVEERDTSLYEKVIEEINSGTYCFKTEILFDALKKVKPNNLQEEYYLTDVVKIFVKEGLDVAAHTAKDCAEILGINSRKQLAEVNKIMYQRINERLMESGVTIVDPATTFIDDEVVIKSDTVINPFTLIRGKTKIGKNCVIGPFVNIKDKTVRDGEEVSDGI